MSGAYAKLPEDVAAEKRIRDRLRHAYKTGLFGDLRYFRALRLQAPGIVAEFTLAALITIAALMFLFRDLNVTGLIPVVKFCIYFVLVIGVCFWISGRIWRLAGIRVRDAFRFLVRNMWTLAVTTLVAVSAILSLLFPELNDEKQAPITSPAETPVTEVTEAAHVQSPGHVLPQHQRIFAGQGWQILHNKDLSYTKVPVDLAPGRCARRGADWILADRRDFEELEDELKSGGHVGTFWTASRKPNSNLDYFLEADGSSRFRWALSGNDSERIVLCILAVSI